MQLLSNYLMGIFNDEVQQTKTLDKDRNQARVKAKTGFTMSRFLNYLMIFPESISADAYLRSISPIWKSNNVTEN